MIKTTNNTTKLKEKKDDILDANSLFNEQLVEIISEIKTKLNVISFKHNAEVIFAGNINELNVKVKSENKESVKIIENLINDYLK
jgi:hypothetical protein